MADANPTIAHLRYRKREAPSEADILTEARELLQYDPVRGGFIWIKLRGRVPHDLLGRVAGGESGRGYLCLNLLHHRFSVHRLVWLWHHGSWPDSMLDHINGDRKDNRIENLRMVTTAQNVWNRAKRSGELAIGVGRNSAGKFVARIQAQPGEKVYLGSFDTHPEAAAAYIGAAIILHGKHAVFKRRMGKNSPNTLEKR